MTPALIQQREDAALGAAWRRVEAASEALGGWLFHGLYPVGNGWRSSAWHAGLDAPIGRWSADPTEALTALAEALEAKRAAE